MNVALPNYFFADLPPEATLNPGMIAEACQTLKRNRERYLAHRSTHSMVILLTNLARQWLEPDFQFRKLALEAGPAATGFSRVTLANGLDAFFQQLTPEGFQTLLQQDLGDPRRLDQMTSTVLEEKTGREALATGPELLGQSVQEPGGHATSLPGSQFTNRFSQSRGAFSSGFDDPERGVPVLPEPTLRTMVLAVLTRSAQFVRSAPGTSFLPRLFAHSLYATDPKLGACIEVAEWRTESGELEKALFEAADCVTATGSESSLAELRQWVPRNTRLLNFPQCVSFAYVACETLSVRKERELIAQAAGSVVAWNQLGSLAPHVIYVQEGGSLGAEQFAEVLARELERREETEPHRELSAQAETEIASRRSIYELRAAHAPETRFWRSKNSPAWTVVYETDPRFQLSCLNRFIYVKGVKDLTDALHSADNVRGRVSTVGLAAPEHEARKLSTELARWGANRVCSLHQMQNPPLAGHGDGRISLSDLIRWTDWETG